MSKAKITITGNIEKPFKIRDAGTVDLLFKTTMSEVVPKGLKPLGDSFALVHVAPKTWEKVSSEVKPDSFFVIQGEAKANKNNKEIPFFEIIAFDIALKEQTKKSNTEPKAEQTKTKTPTKPQPQTVNPIQEVKKKEQPKKVENPKSQEFMKWCTENDVINVPTSDIVLSEDIHLRTYSVNFKGALKYINNSNGLNQPIAIRRTEEGKYSVVIGMCGYVIAKVLSLETVPAVITNLTHKELTKKLGMS